MSQLNKNAKRAKHNRRRDMLEISSKKQLVEALISCLEYLDQCSSQMPAIRLSECLDSLWEEGGAIADEAGLVH